jgi:thiol-disulfide isomerase/thioredoxin
MNAPEPRSANRWIHWVVTVLVFVALYAWMTRGNVSPFIGKQAPALSLPVAAGNDAEERSRINLAEIDGVVVLEFWASWCGACQRTTPILNDLHEQFRSEGVAFYAVNVEPIDRQRLQAAHAAFGTAFPSLHDRSGEVQRRYAIQSLPTILVVGRDARVRWASTGIPSKMRLRAAISEALDAPGPGTVDGSVRR